MNIAFNGLFITRPYSGMGQYSINLLRELADKLKRHQITVFTPEPVNADLPKNLKLQTVLPSRRWLGRGLALDRWETHDLAEAVQAAKADLYHAPYPTPRIKLDIPVVMTVHDMIPYRYKEYAQGPRRQIKLGRQKRGMVDADAVLTVSEYSRQEIISLTSVDPAHVHLTYDGIDDRFRKPAGKRQVDAVRSRYGLTRPYVLYFGGFDYRKNVRRLVKGFAKSGLASSHDLVIAGAVSAPRTSLYADFNELPQLLRAAGINLQTQVLGFVQEDEKHALLTGAEAFVYPSIAEGFGMPVAESLAVGTSVVAGNIPVNRELFPKSLTTFPPTDETALARALRERVKDPDPAKVRAGKREVARYTWEAAAEKTADIYKNLTK